MAAVTLSLLGPPQISRADGTAVVRARKELALLAYLAVESRQAHSRDTLLGMFWPEAAEEAARNSLRVALANLRTALGEAGGPYLSTSRHSVQFSRTSDHTLDVAAFEARLTTRHAHRHEDGALCAECAARLTQAIALYRGDFLSGFALPDSTLFEEWALIQREQLHQQALEALGMLAAYHEQQGDEAALARAARRQIELEPWREQAHRQLMRALAAMGDRAAALAAYERCRQVLKAELGVEPEQETRALFEHISAGALRIDNAELRTASSDQGQFSIRHNLPAHLTPFVGREHELAELAARLGQADVRLLTLVGAGGMGKTRLALEIARLRLADPSSNQPDPIVEPARPAFPDGVFFVALAPLTATTSIVLAIATVIGLSLHGDPKQVLLHFLRDKRLLLILDNFEHLLEGVELVLDILQTAPLVQLIATSRERLKVRGEHVYLIEGMDYRAEDRATSSAIRLFVQSARRVRADFKLSEDKLPLLLRICELAQGMPLGIELAAAWVEILPLERIAAEIERSADFLSFDWRDAPERQRSMRAVFDWSWHLLNEAEQQALRRLSVFRGGCTLDAAQLVVNTSLRVLTSLVHKSLLRWSWAQGEAGRYEIHELLRQFAALQLDADDERAALEARHSDYSLSFVQERERRLTRNEPRQAAAEIRGELDNVRQAWAWAAAHMRLDQLDRSAHPLAQFYLQTGLRAEGDQAQALAAKYIRDALSREVSDQPAQGKSQRVLSKLLSFQARSRHFQSAYDAALRLARQAVDLGQASGSLEGEAMGVFIWGAVLARWGQPLEARPLFERALRLVRSATDSRPDFESLSEIEWWAENWLGIVALLLDDYAEARDRITHALQLCRARGSLVGEMNCLHRLATIAITVGDYAGACRDSEQTLQLARALSHRWGEGAAQLQLGQALHVFGEYTRAAKLIEGALAIFREIGHRTYEAGTLAHLGHLADSLGDYARARDRLEQALQLSQAVHSHEPTLDALLFLSSLSNHMGNHEQALSYAEQAWQIVQGMGSRRRQAQVLVARGRALAGTLRPIEAVTAYQQALKLYAEIGGMAVLTSAPQASLAAVALAQGELALALAHVEAILSLLAADEPFVLDEPFEVYLTCYRVLQASGDIRAANLLHRAEQRLRECAEQITDDALRRSFLEHVAAHHAILTAAHTTAPPVVVK
jgi:DNA-binding SARP family transcriptional activator/predicted ATPase